MKMSTCLPLVLRILPLVLRILPLVLRILPSAPHPAVCSAGV
jgi:hypothetical protein